MFLTLADQRRRVVSMARGLFAKSEDSIPVAQIDHYVSQGYLLIQQECRVWTKEHSADVVSGRTWYPVPDDFLDDGVAEETVRIMSGGDWLGWPGLKRIHWDSMLNLWPELPDADGDTGPAFWAYSGRNMDSNLASKRQLVFMPPPSGNATDGLLFDYFPHPGELQVVYDQDVIRGTFTNGDGTVVLSTTGAGTKIVEGRAIGVKDSADALPEKWYRIVSKTDAQTMEVYPAFEESTVASARFVISDVSPIEHHRPGLCQYAPAEYAWFRLKEADNRGVDVEYERASWLRELSRIKGKAMAGAGRKIDPLSRSPHPALRGTGSR